MTRQFLYSSLLLLAATSPAFAATCDDSFQKKGNPLTGTTYTASVTVPNLSTKSAIGQMGVIAKKANKDVLSSDEDAGSMLIEEPESFSHKPIPMIVSVSSEGSASTVGMLVKLNKGAFGSADGIRKEMCDLLTQVKSGRAGEQFAKAAPTASITEISAEKLGFMLRNQAEDNQAAIESRYKGKVYAITGKVGNVLKSGTYNVSFQMLGESGGRIDFSNVTVTCAFAPSQAAFAMALRPKERVTLVGVVDRYDQILRVLWLENCKGS